MSKIPFSRSKGKDSLDVLKIDYKDAIQLSIVFN
jgi:hypothetical protein